MTSLSKIVLINWMYFQKVTINLKGNTAIVGVNGTGKSTIIDAIQMLLLGNRASKFNANANAEKRTLESYVRGAVKVEDKPFLRPGDVVSYLALEIVDSSGVKHVFGMNLEYKYNLSKLSDPKYFYVKDLELNDEIFINDNYPKTYDILSRELKKTYDFTSFTTLTYYQYKLKDILGLKDEKAYFKTLSRAVGIKNITDCNTFMNQFVLDENPIDVSSIKENIIEMERVSKTIENEEAKYNSLNEIVNLALNLENCKQELEIKKNLKYLIQVELNNNIIASLKEENNEFSSNVDEKTKEKERYETYKFDKRTEWAELNQLLNNKYPDLPKLKESLINKQKEYDLVHYNLNTLKTKCQNETIHIEELAKLKIDGYDEFYKCLKDLSSTEIVKRSFFNFRQSLVKEKNNYELENYNVTAQIEQIRENMRVLSKIIEKLKSNQRSYKSELTDFVLYLKKGLYDKYGKDIEIKFLSEYLDITDEEWRNAIEGYLGVQKFYIILPNEYYDDAIKLYNDKKDFYQTKIINGKKIPDLEASKDTLGELIEASNETALNYARYLLNRVYRASSLKDLENYDIAITKECMLYQGYTTGRINPRYYNEQYIGQNGLKNQLKHRSSQYEELETKALKLSAKYQKLKTIITKVDDMIAFITSIIENGYYFESIDKDTLLFDEVNTLSEKIYFYNNDPNVIEISDKMTKIMHEIDECTKKVDELTNEVINIKANITANDREITDLEETTFTLYNLLELSSDSVKSCASEQLKNLKISKSLVSKIENDILIIDRNNSKKQADIEYLMKSCRDNYNVNIEPTYDSLSQFKEEALKIDQSVFKYKSKLIEISSKNKKLFFSQFLTKLYLSIENAYKTIDNLNNSLKEFKFGNDFYKIKMTITQNKDFEIIYNYAREYQSDDANRGLFIDGDRKDKERARIMDILNLYMFADDQVIQNSILDYRNYLYFDVEAHTPNGVKLLNEVMRTQSGGEVQVPFYILSGVAFQQTLDYKRNKDALGIVLYDEAFDKMDSGRIQAMLEFYKVSLNLQIILASPGKLSALADNVETIVAVIRDGENAIVSDISHEL